MNELNLINEKEIIMQDGIICMNAESIGMALGYSEPRIAINKIYNRNQDELDNYSVVTKMVTVDGKSYNQRLFTEEGIYIISMLANTSKAKAFRRELAAFLKQKRLEALQDAKAQGYITADKINARYRNPIKLDSYILGCRIRLRSSMFQISRIHKARSGNKFTQ